MEEIYKTITRIVEAQKKARRENNFLGLMTNAEALLEYIPDIIQYSVSMEHEYRVIEAKLADGSTDGKRNSGAYAETQAKSSVEYKEWQRAKLMIDWSYEMVNLSKKLAGTVLKDETN